jgi:hypothetical protein
MSLYRCSACNYESKYITSVKNHINRKNKCSDDKIPTLIKIEVEIKCEFCLKNLCNINGLNAHLKICKIKRDIERKQREKTKEEKEKDNKIKKLEKMVERLAKQPNVSNSNSNSNNMTNSNNTTNNNMFNITISLTPYNDPNMEGMQQYLEAAVRKTFLSVPTLIESVHFNDEYPENQNICITNRRTKDAKVFDGKKWRTIKKDLLINEIVDTYERELTNYAEEHGKTKYIKEYDSAKKRGNGEKDLKEEVHNVIYDNSDKVNTKIKEVQKPIKLIEEQEQESESNSEESEKESESGSETDSEPPPLDVYAEFYEKHRSVSESDSDPETEPE